jgi:hypothetical protein
VTDKWERLQWVMSVGVFHGPEFGHRVDCWADNLLKEPLVRGSWDWKGVGMPATKLVDIRSTVDSILSEHFVTRYGVQGEFPQRWTGEPEPF